MKINIQSKLDEFFTILKKKNSSNLSLMGGEMGEILFLLELYKLNNSEEVLELLQKKIELSFEKINNTDLITFSSGFSGIGWIYSYLCKEGVVNNDIEILLTQIDEIVTKNTHYLIKINDYDFLHGAIGHGIYFLERNNKVLLSVIIEALYNSAIKNENGTCWVSDYIIDDEFNSKKVYNLSLSHGSASIISFLSQVLKAYKIDFPIRRKAVYLLEESVKFVLSKKFSTNKSIFPNVCEIDNNTIERNGSRLSWCYGDLGISIALWQAGEVLEDNAIKQEAIEICLHTTKRKKVDDTGVIDAGICHGTSGIAHIYNRMYNYTNNIEFEKAANYWINETLKMAKFKDGLAGYKSYQSEKYGGWQNDFGLLEGISGVGLVMLSYTNNSSAWDRCLLLS